MDLTGNKYENCGLTSAEIEDAFLDASAAEDAAGALAAANTTEEIQKVVDKVESRATESMKEALREKYKDQPGEAERSIKKLENAEVKGDTWHTGSVSRRQNQHSSTTFRKCKGPISLSDPSNP